MIMGWNVSELITNFLKNMLLKKMCGKENSFPQLKKNFVVFFNMFSVYFFTMLFGKKAHIFLDIIDKLLYIIPT
jgi:hypothetical protein